MPRVEVKFEQDFRPIGKRDADIAIVYEQPHNAENNTFLKGSESRQLDSFLNKAGIDLYSCYRTTVAKKEMRGFSSRMYKKGYATDELQIHWRKLEKELKAVDPNVIITLGKEALRAVTQRTDISEHNYRGSILDSPAGKVIPTFDIRYIFKVWEDNPIMIFDLIRAKEESLSPELNLPERELLTDPTFSEIKNFINHCKEQEKLSFDIETIKGQSDEYKYIDCVGLAPSANLAMCVPLCKANGKNIWTIQEEMEIRYMLADLLADKNIMKIAQNAQFDISHLEDNGIPIENLYFDTMNAAKVIEPEFPKGLDFLVSVYTREPYYKDTSATERWIYNAKDAACTFEVHEGQLNDLAERGLIEFYFNHVHPLIRLFINVSRRGVKIDQQKFDKLDQELDKEVIKLQKELKELTEKDINVYSVTDMRQYIYDDLGMKPRYNDNDNLDTSSETLKEFDRKTQREEFQVMIDLRKARSRKSSFTGVSISDDGRVRTSYIVSGTESGRLSSKKYVDGTGMNLQNREKGIEREVFIPDKDMIFLGGDLGQAENRVVAYASGDSNMIDVVESEGDIHKQNAAMIFQKPVDTITPDERQLGKRITHGCVTGDHEVLTLDGWLPIKDMKDNQVVAQWDIDGNIDFVLAEKYVQDFDGEMIEINTTAGHVKMTPDHRIPYKTSPTNPLKEVFAGYTWEKSMKLITNGLLRSSQKYSEENILCARLAVAIQADATRRSSNTMEFHLKKKDKIKRLIKLTSGNIDISEWADETYALRLRKEDWPGIEKYLSWKKDKTFKWSLLHAPIEIKEAILDEITYWDGNKGDVGVAERYSTTNKTNADIIQALCHSINRQAILKVKSREGNRLDLYRLTINNRNLTHVQAGKITTSHYKGQVYCVTVPSSYFLIRYKNKITVTGNSNYKMGSILFAKIAGIETSVAKRLQRQYFDAYPMVEVWHKEIERTIRQTRQLTNPFGRIRTFHGRINNSTINTAVSFIPQSTVADCLHRATWEIYCKLPHPARIALQLHDEIFVQCLPEQEDQVKKIMKTALTRPFDINQYTISIPTDIEKGHNWNEVS